MRPRATSWRSRKRKRRLHGGYRKIGQRRRHPHHRPDPADVAQRDQQRGFGLHAAKQMHHIGFAGGGEHVARGFLDQRGEMRFRVACQQADQPRGIGADQVEQVWRELGDAEQDGPGKRPIQPRADLSRLLRLQFGEPVSQALFGGAAGGNMRPARRTARPRRRNSCHLLWHIRRLSRKPVTGGR